MDLHLDAQTGQRIQREIDLGHFDEPSEVIAHALNLLDAEDEWLLRNKGAIDQRFDESAAQVERGEVYTPEQALELLAQRRAERHP